MSETTTDGVRLTRASLALILAVCGPVATVAVVGFQVREHEARLEDHELRMRQIEREVVQMDRTADQIRAQSEQISELRKEVRELTRQLDRVR